MILLIAAGLRMGGGGTVTPAGPHPVGRLTRLSRVGRLPMRRPRQPKKNSSAALLLLHF